MQNNLVTFKVVLAGDVGVGKTCLLHHAVSEEFLEFIPPTIGIDYKVKTYDDIGGKKVKMFIYDSTGSDRLHSDTCSYYKQADVVVVCYSIDDRSSFEKVNSYLKKVEDYCEEVTTVYLVGTKSDLENLRQNPRDMAEEYAKNRPIRALHFKEVSSKTGQNVKELFETIAKRQL